MPRKSRYPSGNDGADGDFRFDMVEGEILHNVNNDNGRTYQETYEAACQLKGKMSEEEIRKKLCPEPNLQEQRPDYSTHQNDSVRAHNGTEKAMYQAKCDAVKDALAGLPSREAR